MDTAVNTEIKTENPMGGAQHQESLAWLARRLSRLYPEKLLPSQREIAAWFDMSDRLDVEGHGVARLFQAMGLMPVVWQDQPRQDQLPMVAWWPDGAYCLVYGCTADGLWMLEGLSGADQCRELPAAGRYAPVLAPPEREQRPTAQAMFISVLKAHKGVLGQVVAATLVANFLALGASFYSMQVYDRVIPTQGISTLFVLTAGVLLASLLELMLKISRSTILEHALKRVDLELSHRIFLRLLGLRMDQFPASVGTLSSQLRSYESIRGFASSAALYVTVDMPFALFFFVVIASLGGAMVAAVPAISFAIALSIGLFYRKRIQEHARTSTAASNRKLGLLVETVEGAESVKATGAGWHLINRWSALNREVVAEDMKLREYSERTAHLAAFMQQSSYVLMVCTGAWVASGGSITSGALIACSLLSGRVLQPAAALPGLIVQWGHARAALDNLERVFAMEGDNHDVASPLTPDSIKGRFGVSGLRFAYRGRSETLALAELAIEPGEKVGIIGSVGAGKSTLLKLLAGIYKPQEGSVLLDGLDIQHIARGSVAQHIGYLPQDVRLFAGTLRDNLLFGLAGVADQEVIRVCETTGLMGLVSGHAKGLDLDIAEGGTGVSGGQKQLIAFTRLLLARPDVFLLDEPTSAMDEATEARTISVLRAHAAPQQTVVLVTHKPALIGLVNRLIVLSPTGVVLDGPRDIVLQRLRQGRDSTRSVTQVVAGARA